MWILFILNLSIGSEEEVGGGGLEWGEALGNQPTAKSADVSDGPRVRPGQARGARAVSASMRVRSRDGQGTAQTAHDGGVHDREVQSHHQIRARLYPA